MIIPIYYGWREQFAFVGWTVLRCQFCETTQPFQVYVYKRTHHLYGVYLDEGKPFSARLECSFCAWYFDTSIESNVRIDKDWKPPHGKAALFASVCPEASQEAERDSLTPGEVRALLDRLGARASAYFHKESRLMWLVAVVGVVSLIGGGILGACLTTYTPPGLPSRGPDLTMIVGLPFALALTAATYFLLRYMVLPRYVFNNLSEIILKHRVQETDMEAALPWFAKHRTYVGRAVQRLLAG